jgi:hypothetical protein
VITDKEVALEEAKLMEEQVRLRNVNLEKLRRQALEGEELKNQVHQTLSVV